MLLPFTVLGLVLLPNGFPDTQGYSVGAVHCPSDWSSYIMASLIQLTVAGLVILQNGFQCWCSSLSLSGSLYIMASLVQKDTDMVKITVSRVVRLYNGIPGTVRYSVSKCNCPRAGPLI